MGFSTAKRMDKKMSVTVSSEMDSTEPLKNGFLLASYPKIPTSFFMMLLLLNVVTLQCDSCQFPAAWTDSWFQKGVQGPIRIFNGTISSKGDCRQVEGDKFLIESRSDRCQRCVVIHEKHRNVLQYKETFCSPTNTLHTLDEICSEINGDASLFSMFRLPTEPVQCPFHGPYTFTYRGGGNAECSNPISTVEACTVDTRLLFRFQSCADVMGSESRVEELVCLAVWKEGSTRYFVAKLEHKNAKTDEDKLRCFVYEKEKDHPGVLLAQSGDATCDGLLSATEGSRTMKLTKVTHTHAKCHFPEWMTSYKHWHTLDGTQSYQFSHRNNTFKIFNATDEELDLRIVCTREESSGEGLAQLVVHSTSGCKSGYMCMRIHRRALHVIEVQFGNKVDDASDACNIYHFDPHISSFLILTAGTPDPRVCPLIGIYSLDGYHSQLVHILSPEESHQHRSHHSLDGANAMGSTSVLNAGGSRCHTRSTVTAGCDAADKIEFLAECASNTRMRAFQCHGSWEENGTYFLIASSIGSRKRYCMTFTENEKVMQFSGSPDSCVRNVPYNRDIITFNVTSKGMCRTSNQSSRLPINLWTLLLVLGTSWATHLTLFVCNR